MVARYKIVCLFMFCTAARTAHAAPEQVAPSIVEGPGANPNDVQDAAPAPAAPAAGPLDPPLSEGEIAGTQTRPGVADDAPSTAPMPQTDAVSIPDRAPKDDISLEAWNRDDWTLVRPKVALIDMSGYFRLRGDMLRRLDFDNGSVWESTGDGVQETGLPRYLPLNNGHAEYTQTSLRLRIEPRINVSEQIQIISTIDMLDNLILGSTPYSAVPGTAFTRTPVHLLSQGQAPVRRGVNSISDSIVVKRLWGRVTALNEQLSLTFGRMPDHWGMGMLYNDGDCLDCDYGTVADRLALNFRALGHVFTPMVDWVSKGPSLQPFGPHDPKPIDAVAWDDVMQYGLRISREDHPDDIQDAVLHHRPILNYGLSNLVRMQTRDMSLGYYNDQGGLYQPADNPNIDPASLSPVFKGERRDAVLYQGDVFAKYYRDNYEVQAEIATLIGSFKDVMRADSTSAPSEQTTKVFTLGIATEGRYFMRQDRRGTRLALKLGGASGDSRSGMGALDQADTQRGPTRGGFDGALRNFQFSPDYHVDLLLFRRMLGTVTDAFYLRPEVAYRFDDKFQARLAGVYSQAMMGLSTPSAGAGNAGHKPLGFEVDGEVSYGADPGLERGQFMASLAGGILLPLSGFSNPQKAAQLAGGSFAWTLQARVYLTF